MTPKERYKALCETEGAGIPLFQQYWWMEAACGGKRWDVLLSESGDRVEAAMPYLYGSKLGLRYVLQPQLTMFTGPWLAEGAGDAAKADLARQLAALSPAVCSVMCGPEVDDVSAFEAAGFKATPMPTYRFDPLLATDKHMAGAEALRRRDYSRNKALLAIDATLSAAEFAVFHARCHKARSGRVLVGRNLVEHVCDAAICRGQGLLLGARDSKGELQAAAFAPFDSRCGYLLMLAFAPSAPRNAMTYVVWQLVDALQGRTKAFDFEGGSDEGVGRFYASFGARRVERWRLTKCRLPLLERLLLG